ncbi:hypothetical protein PHK61_31200 [Actinomycetospora lutea]|uniref:hypothetical protein n=1 Tax=Actinomycetospora lutea TaxID=663604 RepID=UPI0023670304|nr:hypothetical protein [Actinomycetospora lutea]MDD7942888.1 hypothetical protein [Actinomycetospora lutea]
MKELAEASVAIEGFPSFSSATAQRIVTDGAVPKDADTLVCLARTLQGDPERDEFWREVWRNLSAQRDSTRNFLIEPTQAEPLAREAGLVEIRWTGTEVRLAFEREGAVATARLEIDTISSPRGWANFVPKGSNEARSFLGYFLGVNELPPPRWVVWRKESIEVPIEGIAPQALKETIDSAVSASPGVRDNHPRPLLEQVLRESEVVFNWKVGMDTRISAEEVEGLLVLIDSHISATRLSELTFVVDHEIDRVLYARSGLTRRRFGDPLMSKSVSSWELADRLECSVLVLPIAAREAVRSCKGKRIYGDDRFRVGSARAIQSWITERGLSDKDDPALFKYLEYALIDRLLATSLAAFTALFLLAILLTKLL